MGKRKSAAVNTVPERVGVIKAHFQDGSDYEGVILSKVDLPKLLKALEAKDIKVAEPKDVAKVVQVALDAFKGTPKEGACDDCNGLSDTEEFEECPYCSEESTKAPPAPESGTHPVAKVEPESTPAPAALAKVEPAAPVDDLKPSTAIVTVAELDKAVEDVHKLKAGAAESHWHLGQKVLEIYERALWKLRLDGDAQRYKSWEAFVLHELQFTHTTANRLMDVAKAYGIDQVRALGYKKLAITLTVEGKDRENLLAAAEKGASAAALSGEAKEIKRQQGHVRARRDTGTVPEDHEKTGRQGSKPREDKIVVAQLLTTQKVQLFKKPASKKTPKEEWKRAKRLSDFPFGTYEMPGDVIMTFHLLEDTNGLILKIMTTRKEA